MKRREFITLLGGAAAAWPLAAQAQQADGCGGSACSCIWPRTTRIYRPAWLHFREGLQELGWIDGRNIRIEYRFGAGNTDRYRDYAAELISLGPDVILVSSGSALAAVQKTTRTVPIVFVNVSDPVGAGYVASLARPGANTTGFTLFEYSIGGNGWSCSNS